jgi:tetratricopeptide (TPR) repeat protein
MTGDKVARADLLVSIVYLDCLEGRYLDAAVRLEEVRCLLEAARSSPGAPHVWAAYHKRMGDVKQELAGPGEALSHYETALELYRGQGDRVGESAVINNMSSCHSAAGDHERSLELLHDAARLNTQIDDALGLAIAHYNLAETYGSLNQVSLAREYYQRYMDASARIGNELGMGYGHFGLGYLAWLENDLPSAEVSYRDSAEVFRRLGTSQLATMSMIRLVEVLFEQGKFDDGAEELCRLEESLAPDATERRVELCYLEAMHLLLRPAPPHAAPGFPLRATELLTSALERVRPDDVAQVMKCSHFLAKALVANGETDRATQTLERALTAFRAQLARIANHSYRSSLIQGREIRRIREVYEQLTGSRWDPYAQDGR